MTSARAALEERIDRREAVVAVVGLGYVGLPVAYSAHEAGFRVIGFDVDAAKVRSLEAGKNYLKHLGKGMTERLASSDRFRATNDPSAIAEADAVLLCVPTPLGRHDEPDLSYVLDSTRMVAKSLRPGQLVALESTTYPGTTRGELLPILTSTGLKPGEDFFLAYSPEREDPGSAGYSTATIPKLVGGIDDASGDVAHRFYSAFIREVHRVRTAEIAESAKILENVYRAVNIAMVNELKVILDRMDIDVWEVIEAAKTKPFGFQAFYPGPGLGGHCIPIDPFYLTWKAREVGHTTRFIELAGEINREMPRWVVARAMEALNDDAKALRGSRVLVIGLAYKPDVDDTRESPAAEVIKLLLDAGADVSYHDPHVPVFPPMRRHQREMSSVELSPERLASADCVLVITDHKAVDWASIGEHAELIVDTRNAMGRFGVACRGRVVKA